MFGIILSVLINGLLAFGTYKLYKKKDKLYYLLFCSFFSLELIKTILLRKQLTSTTSIIYTLLETIVIVTGCAIFYKQEIYKKK